VSGRCALLIDFGSTYTKLRAVNLDEGRILGSGQGPSTVTADVNIGLNAALADLEARIGGLPRFLHRLASSSAAGGLRMVTIGLTEEYTAEAARRAALGAGAKLVGAFSYRLTRGDGMRISELAPDIVLLAGGADGGNTEVILHNAGVLAGLPLACPIVVAGNRNAADDVAAILAGGGKQAVITGNVMPRFRVLDVAPARAAIRQVFIDRIVEAKGIDRARAHVDGVLMPTPAAVLDGAALLSAEGLGDLLVVDVGGATTDVHSIADGAPSSVTTIVQGLPEPHAKRTVEGDLGMRHNASGIVEAVGAQAFAAALGLTEGDLKTLLDRLARDPERLPQDETEAALDRALATFATRIAVARHAGSLETVYTAAGPALVQTGKDLTGIRAVIGTGGPLVHSPDAGAILEAALFDPAAPASLRPKAPKLLVDRDYVLYAVGLVAQVDPKAAAALGVASLSTPQ
jgi:uncharacterized protein (TIGR01319 family)